LEISVIERSGFIGMDFWKRSQKIDLPNFARSERENTSFNFQSSLIFEKEISGNVAAYLFPLLPP
jgi:hypothetical protein